MLFSNFLYTFALEKNINVHMEDFNYKEIHSKKFYQSITEIVFEAVKEVPFKKVATKGSKETWKLFWLFPITFETHKEDVYSINYNDYTESKLNKSSIYFLSDGKVMRTALVKIYYGSHDTIYRFKTNQEALNFLDNVKKTCKECGNELL